MSNFKSYDPIRAGSIDGTDAEPHDNAVIRAVNSVYQPPRQSGKADNTLFVGRLSSKTDEKSLKSCFERFGTVIRATVIRDVVTGHSKLYGFVEFKHKDQAQEAYRQMHKFMLEQSEIIVEFEASRTVKGWKPRRLGGGYGGKRESGQLRFGGRDRPFIKPIVDTKARGSVSYKN